MDAARCAACARASPRRAAPSARCSAGSAGRRCRRRRGGSGRRRRRARRGPSRRRPAASAGRRRGRSGRRRAAGTSSRSRRPGARPRARGRRRTAPPAARRCRRRSSARASPTWRMFRPVPGVHRRGDADHARVAAALRQQRLAEDRRVGRGGGGGASDAAFGGLDDVAVGDRARLRGVPALHALQPAVLGGREALALDRRDVHDDRPLRGERAAQRDAQRVHVVAVDHPDVDPVELLPQQAGRRERLDRLLQLRARGARTPRRCRRAASRGRPRCRRARATGAGSGGCG